MGITSEVSEIIQSSKEQFEKAMTTSLAVNVLKNIVLRSMPAEGNEMEKINDPKFRTSFNSILNPITANLIDRYQSVGQFDTGNLFTSMVTSIADSVSLESNYRTESLESKFILNKIPLDSNREWIREIEKTYESLKFSNEDIKNRLSSNLKYIRSFEAGREIIDDIKNEVKKSIDETESKNELVEGTLQEIADYKKEVAPPDDEYLDAENPDDQAKASGDAEGGTDDIDANIGGAEGEGEENTAGADETGGEGDAAGEGSSDIPSGEDPLAGGDEGGDDLDLDSTDDIGGDTGGALAEGDLGGATGDAAGGTGGLPGEEGLGSVRQVKQGNVVININASGESSDPTKSTEGFFTPKIGQNSGNSIEEAIKKILSISRIKNVIKKSLSKIEATSLIRDESALKKTGEKIEHEHRPVSMPNSSTKVSGGWKYQKVDNAYLDFVYTVYIQPENRPPFIPERSYFVTNVWIPFLKNGTLKKKEIVSYSNNKKSGESSCSTVSTHNNGSFTSKALKKAKSSLPLHTAESFAKSYIPIHERDLSDVSFPDVKIMGSEAVNAVGDVRKELDIRIAGARYAVEKSSTLSKEDRDTLFGKIEKLNTIGSEALSCTNIWNNALHKLGLTQNGLLNSNESTLFIARNIISRFLTKTKIPNALPLPYTSRENVLSNAFDIIQLRHILSSQEHPVKAALDDLVSRENVFYRNIVTIDDTETKDKATAVVDTTDMVYNKALTANFITDYNIKAWEQNVGKDQKDTNAEVCSRVEDKFKALYQRELNGEEKEIIKATTNNHDVTEIIPTPYEKFLIKLSKESLAAKSIENDKQISSLSKEENEDNRFKAKVFTSLVKSLERFNLINKDDLMEMDNFCESINVNLLHS
jgi:hypothetical protein